METTEVQRLQSRLKEMGVKQFRPFWGPEAHKHTPEELAAELNRVLDCIERGECEEIFDLDNGLKFESHEQCKEFYDLYPEPVWSMSVELSRDTYLQRRKEYDEALQVNYKNFMAEQCKKT